MAKANATNNDKDTVEIPDYLKVADFNAIKGETFGGQSDILDIDEEQTVGPLVSLGFRMFDPGTGKEIALYEARDAKDHVWRMPIASNFIRQMESGSVNKGDTYFVKRLKDVEKKKGLGAGQMMEMYQIKVSARASA